MKKGRCIIHELAQVISEDVALKAVWLDATHKKVSFAFQDGQETKECRKRLEEIVSQYRPDHDSSCIQDAWQVDCELCERGVSQPMPANIRLVKMPGAGVLLEKEIALAPSHSFRWYQFHWIHLRPRQIVLPFELTTLTGWKRELLAAVVCGAATLIGFLLEKNIFGATEQFSNILYSLAYLAGAWFPASHMWGLLRKGIVDVHFLMLCVALGAAVIGHMWEGAILLFLFSLSGALEEMAMANTEREIQSLYKAAPKKAMVIDVNGHEREVAVDHLSVGMNLRVRPGEQFPVDAEIIKGTSSVDESNLTGEAEPIDKKPGDNVFSGTLNLWGSVDCRVLKLAEESVLAKIIRLIQEAQKSKAPAQRFTDKFSTGYTYFILSCSVIMFFVWWKVMGMAPFAAVKGEPSAFYRAMTLLVVASPCALVLSIPSAILAGIAAAAKHGILFRGGVAIEKLAEVTRVALDKTGTLTTGDLQVIEVKSFPIGREDDVLKIAASVGFHSAHPVSRAIVRAYKKKNGTMVHTENFKSITGMGLEAFIYENAGDAKKSVIMGRRDIFGAKPWLDEIPLPKPGVTETIVECEGLHGQILLMDQVREASASLLRQLECQGLKVTMLTGDRKEAADLIANHLNVSDIRSGLKPHEKVQIIQQWTKDGEKVAMVGDGVNDAPSLAAAYVAVGMGVRGSDAVLEQADVVLMQDRLENFNYAFNLSKKARRIIYQNLTISLGVIAILVFSALGGMIPLTIGVIGHEGSTVLVVLNSLRLLISHPALVKASV